jgi:alpha/beta hydrolase
MAIEKVLKNTSIHYWINNEEKQNAIIFIHPAFTNHTCFDSQLEYFKDFKIILLDLIGHGKSIGKGKLEDTAEYIKQIMEVEKIIKINLVGISIGAIIVQDFANKYPELVLSLICVGGYDCNNVDKEIKKNSGKGIPRLILKAIFSIKSFAKEQTKRAIYTKSAQEKAYKMFLEFKKSSFRYFPALDKLTNKYVTPSKRGYPLLIGVGEYDSDGLKEAAMIWHKKESDSQYIMFSNAGHIVNMDTPEQFNEVVRKIITSVDPN